MQTICRTFEPNRGSKVTKAQIADLQSSIFAAMLLRYLSYSGSEKSSPACSVWRFACGLTVLGKFFLATSFMAFAEGSSSGEKGRESRWSTAYVNQIQLPHWLIMAGAAFPLFGVFGIVARRRS
jgi:hypothetical protein